jgi:deoxyribonuclease-4
MKLGVHVSVSGGVDKAVDRAVELGCNTFQIFVSNPRGWKPTIIGDDEAKLFSTKYKAAKMQDAFTHGIYLINLATEDEYIKELSIESLISGLINTQKLGLIGLVTHIGSHHGVGIEKGIERVVEAVETILKDAIGSVPLLLENTAGAGNLVGDKIYEIGEIIKRIGSERVGFCLDTAHAYESGWQIDTKDGLEKTLSEIDEFIGINKLKAIHLNDSKTEFNSKRDRHETFGKGLIGQEALTRLINHPQLKDKPFVMETPEIKHGEAGREVIDFVRSLSK